MTKAPVVAPVLQGEAAALRHDIRKQACGLLEEDEGTGEEEGYLQRETAAL